MKIYKERSIFKDKAYAPSVQCSVAVGGVFVQYTEAACANTRAMCSAVYSHNHVYE